MSPESTPTLPEIWPIKVVLPAPFGPMSACTSRACTSSVTLSVATTPPKRFETPLSSSTAPPREKPGDALRREKNDGEHHQADPQVGVLLVVGRHLREPGNRVVRDEVLEHQEHRRADHAAPQVPDAAEDHHDHERARLHPVKNIGIDVLA